MTQRLTAEQLRAIDVRVGANLLKFRERANMSKAELAHKLDLTPQQVSKYETAVTRLSASRMVQIAVVMGLDVCDLLDGAL